VCLRYFNVVGCAQPELADTGGTNLFPLVFRALQTGDRPVVFGDDYPTRDGTCVRDYIHVQDLAEAHVSAARLLMGSGKRHDVVNIGCGRGHTVLEVLATIGAVSGRDTTPAILPRRPGDPAGMVAEPSLARSLLGWTAQRDLDEMVHSAWEGAHGQALQRSHAGAGQDGRPDRPEER
jgi:UDP-glucose 4-epimerase